MMMEYLGHKSPLWGKVEVHHSKNKVLNVCNDTLEISDAILEAYLNDEIILSQESSNNTIMAAMGSNSSTSTTASGNNLPSDVVVPPLFGLANSLDQALLQPPLVPPVLPLIPPVLPPIPPVLPPPPIKMFANACLYLVVSPCQLICKIGQSTSTFPRLYDRYRLCWLEAFSLFIFEINPELEQFPIAKIEECAFSMLDLYFKHPLRISVYA
jgi:hypothetical protein